MKAILLAFGKTDGVDYQINDLLSMPAITDYGYDDQTAFDGAVDNANEDENRVTPCEEDPLCLCELSRHWAWVTFGIDCSDQRVMYWYHPDYLGNTEFITDLNGDPYQFFLYSPWGESLESHHKHSNQMAFAYDSPYRFNAKELDAETGNYYYGARYYDPKVSVWLSVDPLAEKFPFVTPYNFVENNPIMLIDPTGLGPELDVANNQESKTDLLSLVNAENRDRVIIDADGHVCVDLDGLSDKEVAADKGLALINDLVKADEKYLFESGEIAYMGDRPKDLNLDKNGVINASNGGEDSEDAYNEVPGNGYDGHVAISASGTFVDTMNQTKHVRKSTIYHELAESYLRTTGKIDFNGNSRNGGFGAHYRAERMEGNYFGNPSPGGAVFHPASRTKVQTYLINGIINGAIKV